MSVSPVERVPLELLSMNRAVRSFDLVDSIHGYEPRN